MRDPETFLVETPVHGRVLVRRAPDAVRRVLVGFHGYAEAAEAMLDRLQSIPGIEAWTLVAVQGLNRFYRGRTEEAVAGWMTRQDRETAIADNIGYVDAALDAALAGLSFSPPIVHAGFSQGVAMAFRAAVRGRRSCAGVIAVGGDVPPELLADGGARFPRTLLVRGESDDWYTGGKLQADEAGLRRRGVAVETSVVPGGHEWNTAVSRAAASFLEEVQL